MRRVLSVVLGAAILITVGFANGATTWAQEGDAFDADIPISYFTTITGEVMVREAIITDDRLHIRFGATGVDDWYYELNMMLPVPERDGDYRFTTSCQPNPDGYGVYTLCEGDIIRAGVSARDTLSIPWDWLAEEMTIYLTREGDRISGEIESTMVTVERVAQIRGERFSVNGGFENLPLDDTDFRADLSMFPEAEISAVAEITDDSLTILFTAQGDALFPYQEVYIVVPVPPAAKSRVFTRTCPPGSETTGVYTDCEGDVIAAGLTARDEFFLPWDWRMEDMTLWMWYDGETLDGQFAADLVTIEAGGSRSEVAGMFANLPVERNDSEY